jgi:hypothetical protein
VPDDGVEHRAVTSSFPFMNAATVATLLPGASSEAHGVGVGAGVTTGVAVGVGDAVGVGVGVGVGVAASPTITVPVISGWTLQTNVYVPAALNVHSPLQPCVIGKAGSGGTGPAFAPAVCTHDEGGAASNFTLCEDPPVG